MTQEHSPRPVDYLDRMPSYRRLAYAQLASFIDGEDFPAGSRLAILHNDDGSWTIDFSDGETASISGDGTTFAEAWNDIG